MVNKPNTFKIANGINFTTIKDSRFKTGRISISIFLPLNGETVSQNAILPFTLIRSCKRYPDFTKLNRKLSDLYGAELVADIDKIGESQVLSITATFLNDCYALDSECISGEITELLCDIMFAPNVEDGSFTSKAVEQEKRQLIEMIDSEYNDKKVYAKQKCVSIMCEDEKFGINPLGIREEIEELSGKDVYKAWRNMLKQARFEIMMIGNSDHISALKKFEKAFECYIKGKTF